MIRKILLSLLILIAATSVANAEGQNFNERKANLAEVSDIRVGYGAGTIRIVVDVTKKVDYKDFYVENPSRMIVDLKNSWLSPKVQREIELKSLAAKKIRVAQFDPSTVRLVIETMADTKIFHLTGGSKGHRLVIDVGNTDFKPSEDDKSDDAELKAKQDAELKAKQEQEARAKEERELRERQAQELKERQERDRELQEKWEAEQKAKQESELKAKQDAERKAKEEAERKAKEEAELKAKWEKELREKWEREQKEKREQEIKEQREREKALKEKEKQERELKKQQERELKEKREQEIKEQREREKQLEKERKEKEKQERRDKKNKDKDKDKKDDDKEKEVDTPFKELDRDLENLMTLSGKKIVIDPGHGGNDAGAIGPTGVMEKNVTLKVSLELKRLLEAAGAQVIMTRETDTTVSAKGAKASDIEELGARCDVANRIGADIFISIHADSFTRPEARGTTGYYYSKSTSGRGQKLADCIRRNLVEQLGTPSRGTQPCNFYVVKHTDMPATLIELGFISNKDEEKLLDSKEGVQKAAQGILDGIEDYFG